jgi:hypothetical protein
VELSTPPVQEIARYGRVNMIASCLVDSNNPVVLEVVSCGDNTVLSPSNLRDHNNILEQEVVGANIPRIPKVVW